MKKNKVLKYFFLLLICFTLSCGITLLVDFSKPSQNSVETSDAAIHKKTYKAAAFFSPDGGSTFYRGTFSQNGYPNSLGSFSASLWYTDSNWSGQSDWATGGSGNYSGAQIAEIWGKRDGFIWINGTYTTYFSWEIKYTPPTGFESTVFYAKSGISDTASLYGGTFYTTQRSLSGSSSVTISTNSTSIYDEYYYQVYVRPIAYQINYYNSYNSTNYTSKSTRYYNCYNLPSNPTRPGYTFLGWYTSPNGTGTRITSSSVKTSTGPQTLYSHWQQNQYRIDMNILNPASEQDYVSGTVTYYNSFSGNTYHNQTDQPEDMLHYGGYIRISNIVPASGLFVSSVTCRDGNGTISKSGETYTYTLNYSGAPSEGWTDAIEIRMDWMYTVVYNSNFSPHTSSSQSGFKNGISSPLMTIREIGFSRTGYDFVGWATSSTGSAVYSDGQYVSSLGPNGGNVHLYAVWRAKTYSVIYNLNCSPYSTYGHTGFTYDRSSPLKRVEEIGFSRTGYDFAGWATSSSGGVVYSNGQSVSTLGPNGGSVNLYAVWRAKTYYIYFNANGGSGNMGSLGVTYNSGSKILTSNAFTRANNYFNCWNTSPNGSGTKYFENQAVSNITSNITLYAQWEETWNAHASPSLSGSGTKDSPYLVAWEEDLAYISRAVDNGTSFSGVYFKQISNIELGGKLWKPIGSSASKAFKGNYDGNGFLITNMTTSSAREGSAAGNYLYSNVGLFGYAVGATLKDINLFSGNVYGRGNVGSIAGYVEAISAGTTKTGSVEGCRSRVSVFGLNNCGMIGASKGCDIISCLNYGNVSASSSAGGILGCNLSTKMKIINCLARCNVSGVDSGGILGSSSVSGTEIISCGFKGSLGAAASNQGLVAGSMISGNIMDCLAITSNKNLGLCASGAVIQNCIYDNGTENRVGSDFSNWSYLASGQPLPNGLAWIGGAGDGLL